MALSMLLMTVRVSESGQTTAFHRQHSVSKGIWGNCKVYAFSKEGMLFSWSNGENF
uniref:Uncharacterized protein n=1 Tax=Marmota marmota marmota TaxID=9994 RepID=A0A8C5ZXN0_MARMA